MALEGIEVAAEQEVLVADEPAEFVNQIVRLVGDQALWQRLSDNGRRFVEQHFAWPVIGEHLRTAFEAAANTRAARRG
jgi:glycosyltransferase involved in cell wall biosynthesis